MKTIELISVLKSKGFEYSWLRKLNWRGHHYKEHFFIKGDCRIKIAGSMIEVQFIQSKNLLRVEGNLIGPFRDGVMFDLDSREMVR